MAILRERAVRRQAPQEPAPVVSHEEVARLAYEMYLDRGCVDGHDFEDWLKAEAILRQRNGQRRH